MSFLKDLRHILLLKTSVLMVHELKHMEFRMPFHFLLVYLIDFKQPSQPGETKLQEAFYIWDLFLSFQILS